MSANPQTLGRLLSVLAPFNEAVSLLGCKIAGVCVAGMTLSIIVGVFFRYALNNSLPWTEEVSLIMMTTVAFMVAPWAYRRGGNVNIEMFIDLLPDRPMRVLRVGLNLLILWILSQLLLEAWNFVARGFSITASTLPLEMGWFYLIVPISFVLMILAGIELIIRDLAVLTSGDQSFDLARIEPSPESE